MSQHVLLILREGKPPRVVGPFLSEVGIQLVIEREELREGEYLVQPLESPSPRHALLPSPVPRDVLCEACGKPYLPTHSIAAPGLNARHPFKLPTVLEVLEGDPEPIPRARLRTARWPGDPGTAMTPEQVSDLAAGGRPIASWIEEHADQLRRFVPPELPTHERWPTEVENP